ncbi:hypothetical protein P7K49_024591 [Saguinus oedipus]|uniref:Uncharacterized protein n=1 Tax=Saguinus oedipus TaxID=9490 RepID=A0ABQ9UPX7_SAGOE|nr:hypothetical protein P7K49_024591 [Saguinus oedipus]
MPGMQGEPPGSPEQRTLMFPPSKASTWGHGLTSAILSRPSDEHHPEVKADGYVDNLAEAVDLLLQHVDK